MSEKKVSTPFGEITIVSREDWPPGTLLIEGPLTDRDYARCVYDRMRGGVSVANCLKQTIDRRMIAITNIGEGVVEKKTAWQWLDEEPHRGTQILDFRPGWHSLSAMGEPITRQEFEARIERCDLSRSRAQRSAVQMVIDDAHQQK